MLVTLYNENENPVIIHDTDSSHEEQKITGNVIQGINVIDSLEFNIYPDNPGYDCLQEYKTRIECKNSIDNDIEFWGRVLRINVTMSSSGEIYKKVICEGCLGFLKDGAVARCTLDNHYLKLTLIYLLERWEPNGYQDECFKFDFSAVDDTANSIQIAPITFEGGSTYDEVMNLVTSNGCELYVKRVEIYGDESYEDYNPYRRIIFLGLSAEPTPISDNPITIGDNLISFSSDTDVSNLCTNIIPYGAKIYTDEDNLERVNIASVNNGLLDLSAESVSKYGVISKTVLFEEVETPQELLSLAQQYLYKYQYPVSNYTITAFDNFLLDHSLPKIKVRHRYFINAPVLGADKLPLKVTQKTLCIENPANDTFTVGETNTASSNAVSVTSADIVSLKDSIATANTVFLNGINAANMRVDKLVAGDIAAIYADIKNLTSKKADIDLANIKEASISTAMIEDAVITTAKIADAAISSAKIGDAAITTVKISDAAITTAKIANAAVKSAQISEAAITAAKIANAAIETAHIANTAITTAKISDAAITTAKIANGAITDAQIENATITTAKIVNGAITTALIAQGAVNTAQIADASITSAKVVELTANKITTGILSVERLELIGSDKSLVYALNNSGELVSTEVNHLDGNFLTDRSITADKIVANEITANEIAAKTITANEIAANAITTDKIAAGSITSAKIGTGAVTAAKVAAGAITADKMNVDDLSAVSAKIGGMTLSESSIYSGTSSMGDTTAGIYLGKDGFRQYSSSSQYVSIANGIITAYNARIYTGTIGGWTLNSKAIYNKTSSMTSTAVGIYVGTDGIRQCASGSYVNLKAGTLTCSDGSNSIVLSKGAIAASSNEIAWKGLSVQSGKYSMGVRASYIDVGAGTNRRLVYGYPDDSGKLGVFLVNSSNTIVGSFYMPSGTDTATVEAANVKIGNMLLTEGSLLGHIAISSFGYPHLLYRQYSNSLELLPTHTGVGNVGTLNNQFGSIYGVNLFQGGSGVANSSDRRKKKDICSVTEEFANRLIDGLKPSSYKYKDGTSDRIHYGAIAQDVEELLITMGLTTQDFGGVVKDYPEKEIVLEDGTIKMVKDEDAVPDYFLRYDEFIMPLVNYCQQLKRRISALEENMK